MTAVELSKAWAAQSWANYDREVGPWRPAEWTVDSITDEPIVVALEDGTFRVTTLDKWFRDPSGNQVLFWMPVPPLPEPPA